MAFVPGFEHDIFISYAHDNNPGGEEGAGGRITCLHRLLTERLKELTGRNLEIWRDTRLARNEVFDETIKREVECSALFLAINSTAYQLSKYCQQEIEWFDRRSREDGYGLSVSSLHRVFNVQLSDISHEQWPAAFKGATQFDFFVKAEGDPIALPAEPDSQQFKKEFDVLLRNLARTLYAFKKVAEDKIQRSSDLPRAPKQFSVFLAATSDSQRQMSRRLAEELKANGIHLVGTVPPPFDAATHDEQVIVELMRARVSVHLFDAWPGVEILGAEHRYYPERQLELAQAQAVTPLIFVPRKLDLAQIENAEHRAYLHRLETTPRPAHGYSYILYDNVGDIVRAVLAVIASLNGDEEISPRIVAGLPRLSSPRDAVNLNEVLASSDDELNKPLKAKPLKKGIFINYRREDSSGEARNLYERLTKHFDPNHVEVFWDIGGIDIGEDFVEKIQNEVGACHVLIALIGRQWLKCVDETGQRRLDNENDFVRLEIVSALDRKIKVIPILLYGTKMPSEAELPDALKLLARRNALDLNHQYWDNSIERLIKAIEGIIA